MNGRRALVFTNWDMFSVYRIENHRSAMMELCSTAFRMARRK